MRILIAEDNRDISKALTAVLEKNSYSVDAVYNGADAYDYAVSGVYDGIILDIMMPRLDGMEVLARLRRENITTPILMLTAKGELSDRVAGLDAGADDYLPKPFAVAELLSRVRAMLRRRSDYQPDIVSINGVNFNKGTLELEYSKAKCRLVTRELQVFEMLSDNMGRIISTDYLMEHIWGWDSEVEVNIVWVTVSNIRKKLQAIKAPLVIRSVRGVGYRLEAENDR